MTEAERLQLAQKLAGLIGDPLPLVWSDDDLFDYAEYVENILAGRRMGENSVLFEVRNADPRWAEDLERRRLAFRKRTSHRQALPKQGSAALRKKGDQTRTKVVAAWRSFSKLPERSRATKIVERLGIRPRTVRGHLKKARKKRKFQCRGCLGISFSLASYCSHGLVAQMWMEVSDDEGENADMYS